LLLEKPWKISLLIGGVSSNTIRTHVRRVLEKTGCGRQAEVIALLTGIASPGMLQTS
jgi:hypothetical protein